MITTLAMLIYYIIPLYPYIYIYISVHFRVTQLPKLGNAIIVWVAALNI